MSEEPTLLNRELAWLEFNQRVLDEACDESVPLVERVKFLAITGSNLDEFFRVRVGELSRLTADGVTRRDPAGMTPSEQLTAVRDRAGAMMTASDACYQTLETSLAQTGWPRLLIDDLDVASRERVDRLFNETVFPVLSPLAIDHDLGAGAAASSASRTAASLPGEVVTLAVQLQANDLFGGETRFALLPLGRTSARVVHLPGGYVLLEDVVRYFLPRFFIDQTIADVTAFRVTRDADITLDNDDTADIVAEMEDVLDARKRGRVVRLELANGTGPQLTEMLAQLFDVGDEAIVRSTAPLGLSAWFGLVPSDQLRDDRDADWPAQTPPEFADVLAEGESIFDVITERDVVNVHPYQSYEPVLTFLEQAADDPDVIAIKQTLYRTASDSRIVDALTRAARNGKHVTVLVELKARFDEARNIDRARDLEEAGVFVTYGVRGLKTHAKLCLVVRRESQGTTRYVHVGTGNYNESTARLYGDVSLFTRDEDIGHDAVAVFNAITGFSQPHSLRKLRWAPLNLRDRFLELIEAEIARAEQGQKASIQIKLNSLVDPKLITALYDASRAGVDVEINVRGICCLKPGVKGLSERVRVVRLVDRFLEHARVFAFHHGGDPLVFISSADWMPRNLDRRIELLAPVEDPAARKTLIDMLDCCLADNVKATRVLSDGTQQPVTVKPGQPVIRAQEVLWQQAVRASESAAQVARTRFVPHEPSDR